MQLKPLEVASKHKTIIILEALIEHENAGVVVLSDFAVKGGKMSVLSLYIKLQ